MSPASGSRVTRKNSGSTHKLGKSLVTLCLWELGVGTTGQLRHASYYGGPRIFRAADGYIQGHTPRRGQTRRTAGPSRHCTPNFRSMHQKSRYLDFSRCIVPFLTDSSHIGGGRTGIVWLRKPPCVALLYDFDVCAPTGWRRGLSGTRRMAPGWACIHIPRPTVRSVLPYLNHFCSSHVHASESLPGERSILIQY